mmetsp:Transcript_41622/g.62126  ORF Transcript_41622/g.62126 Transcript_41622/m.62126 type:complete len:135 (-) Transcript_41622:96-500(-)
MATHLPGRAGGRVLARSSCTGEEAAMGVQLWMIFLGAAMLVHAGSGLMAEKRAAALANEELPDGVGSQVLLEVLLGAALALWGGIGDFKPIRISDSKKVRWESLHERPDFHCYQNRARLMRPLLQASLPSPPSK